MLSRQERRERIALIQTGPVSLETGLTDLQVLKRKRLGLDNVAGSRFSHSYFFIVFKNIFNWFNLILFGVAVAFLILGVGFPGQSEYGITKYGFLIPVLVNLFIGIFQECKAKKVTDKLRILNVPKIKVIRNSLEQVVKSSDVVTDDLIVLESGMQVPVDGKIIRGTIATDDSLLTGEQKERTKSVGDKVYAGTIVISGIAHLQAEAVGKSTYAQRLRVALAKEKKPHSDMTRGVQIFVFALSVLIIPMATIVGVYAYLAGQTGQDVAVQVGTTIVGAIPTGLVLLASGRCALSIISLFREKTSVKELRSVEGLALSTVVCLDKTGTLTTGKMEVDGIDWLGNRPAQLLPFLASVLAEVPDRSETVMALRKAYAVERPYRATRVIPFDSRIKYSGCVFLNDPNFFYALGAPQFLLGGDSFLFDRIEEKAKEGLRVMAFVKRPADDPRKVIPLCLIYLKDQIRPSAPKIIQRLVESGVQIRIISGDDPVTVSAIAKRIGIPGYDKCVSMAGMDKWQSGAAARSQVIFGRANPEQKSYIVHALQEQGHKVAMVIDALNDILAAKAADCSICISHEGGASAAAQVADVTILDGDFSHMPSIIKEGRKSVNNMERAATLFLMKSFLSLAMAASFPVFGHLPYSIEGLYLVTWFVTGIGGFLLGLEDSNDPVHGHFVPNVLSRALPAGLFIFLAVLTVQILTKVGLLPYAYVHARFGNALFEGLATGDWLSYSEFTERVAAYPSSYDAIMSSVFLIEEPLAILTASLAALAVMVKVCSPLTKFRFLCLGVSVFITAFAILVAPMYFLGADSVPNGYKGVYVPFYSSDCVLSVLFTFPLAWQWLVGLALCATPIYALVDELSTAFVFRTKDRFEWPLKVKGLSGDHSIRDSFHNLLGGNGKSRQVK